MKGAIVRKAIITILLVVGVFYAYPAPALEAAPYALSEPKVTDGSDFQTTQTTDIEINETEHADEEKTEEKSESSDFLFKILSIIFGAGTIVLSWLASLLGAKFKHALLIIGEVADVVSSISKGFSDGKFTEQEAQVVRNEIAQLQSVIRSGGTPTLATLQDTNNKLSVIKSRHEK